MNYQIDPAKQIYVRGIFAEHSHDIFPEYSGKVSLWNSGEYSQNNVPGTLNIGIFPEFLNNILRILHAFF